MSTPHLPGHFPSTPVTEKHVNIFDSGVDLFKNQNQSQNQQDQQDLNQNKNKNQNQNQKYQDQDQEVIDSDKKTEPVIAFVPPVEGGAGNQINGFNVSLINANQDTNKENGHAETDNKQEQEDSINDNKSYQNVSSTKAVHHLRLNNSTSEYDSTPASSSFTATIPATTASSIAEEQKQHGQLNSDDDKLNNGYCDQGHSDNQMDQSDETEHRKLRKERPSNIIIPSHENSSERHSNAHSISSALGAVGTTFTAAASPVEAEAINNKFQNENSRNSLGHHSYNNDSTLANGFAPVTNTKMATAGAAFPTESQVFRQQSPATATDTSASEPKSSFNSSRKLRKKPLSNDFGTIQELKSQNETRKKKGLSRIFSKFRN